MLARIIMTNQPVRTNTNSTTTRTHTIAGCWCAGKAFQPDHWEQGKI